MDLVDFIHNITRIEIMEKAHFASMPLPSSFF